MFRKNNSKEIILVSACLLGLATRYDGKSKRNEACIAELVNSILVPVCPEQLGGLTTPRIAASIVSDGGSEVLDGRSTVKTSQGVDVTASFIKGAKIVAEIAEILQVTQVYLKARSPSCGVSGTIGVTAALLREKGPKLTEF